MTTHTAQLTTPTSTTTPATEAHPATQTTPPVNLTALEDQDPTGGTITVSMDWEPVLGAWNTLRDAAHSWDHWQDEPWRVVGELNALADSCDALAALTRGMARAQDRANKARAAADEARRRA